MQLSHSNTLDALRRVQGFLDAQAAALGILVPLLLRTRLDAAVTQLAAFELQQSTAAGTAKGETGNQAVIRKDIRKRFMEPIARIAKASLREVGEYPTMVVSSSTLRNGDFLGAVQTLADSAAKNEKALLDHGMPTDFLVQLRAAITQLTASKAAQGQNVAQRQTATKGIKDTNKVGHDVLALLNSIIAPALKHNTPLLAGWKAAKKVVATLTSLPPQPTGLAPASTPTAAPTGATTPAPATAVTPAPQAAKAAA